MCFEVALTGERKAEGARHTLQQRKTVGALEHQQPSYERWAQSKKSLQLVREQEEGALPIGECG
jgi:hypothetical protein